MQRTRVELGMITPPFGLNLFVLKSVAQSVALTRVYFGGIPFVVADLVKISLVVLFPQIALFLGS